MSSEQLINRREDGQCRHYTPHLNEYVDGRLDGELSWRIRNHLAVCASCRHCAAELSSVVQLLGGAAKAEVSSAFDDLLSARIAALPQGSNRRSIALTPLTRWIGGLGLTPRLLAPLAAGAACLLFVCLSVHPSSTPIGQSAPTGVVAVNDTDDPAVLQTCLAQHRAQSAEDPMADTSAQLLTASVDNIPANPQKNQSLSDADAAVLLDEEM